MDNWSFLNTIIAGTDQLRAQLRDQVGGMTTLEIEEFVRLTGCPGKGRSRTEQLVLDLARAAFLDLIVQMAESRRDCNGPVA